MIRFDIKPRRYGKTTRMIQWFLNGPADEERFLIVSSTAEAQRIRKLVEDMNIEGVDTKRIIAAHRISESLVGRKGVVGIDNLELVLQQLIMQPISRVTATGELYEDN